MRATASVLLLSLWALPTPAQATDYSTKFPNAERLISEGGHWITFGTPGVNWHETLCGGHGDLHVSSVSTTPGYAFGPTGPERFGDALALLTGNWKPDQMAEATVRQVNPFGHPEVEIRLRTSPKDATGYEIMWSALGKEETAYIAIATWNGPGSKPPHYTILKSLKGSEYGVATGDVVKGMIGLFPPELVVDIKALACQLPSTHGLPLSRWSIAEVTRQACRSGLVATISDTTVWRWLHAEAIRPW